MGLRGLADKVAVVVGGATGIGAATAARLAEEGCRVVIGDIAADAAHADGRTHRRRRRARRPTWPSTCRIPHRLPG